ncbi:MAG: hypothetical protein AB8G14_12795 [Ilumatobacter sp.]
MDRSTTSSGVRLTTTPGWGRLARRDSNLLFVAAPVAQQRSAEVDDLFERYDRIGSPAADYTTVPRCVVDWSDPSGHIVVSSDVDLWVPSVSGPTLVEHWVRSLVAGAITELTVVSDATAEVERSRTDLRAGSVNAAAFGLVLPARPTTCSFTQTPANSHLAAITAEPPDPSGMFGLDHTLAPLGPVGYPDDATNRTLKRTHDVRCRRGHANPGSNTECRICHEPLGTALDAVDLRLPDGSIIPIDQPIVIGRAPMAAAARLDGACRLISIDAPSTVSRTHVVLQPADGNPSATDCGAGGRTAVLSPGEHTPQALPPWVPRTVSVGDKIQLGGPTTLTIIQRAASTDDTASTHEPHETT